MDTVILYSFSAHILPYIILLAYAFTLKNYLTGHRYWILILPALFILRFSLTLASPLLFSFTGFADSFFILLGLWVHGTRAKPIQPVIVFFILGMILAGLVYRIASPNPQEWISKGVLWLSLTAFVYRIYRDENIFIFAKRTFLILLFIYSALILLGLEDAANDGLWNISIAFCALAVYFYIGNYLIRKERWKNSLVRYSLKMFSGESVKTQENAPAERDIRFLLKIAGTQTNSDGVMFFTKSDDGSFKRHENSMKFAIGGFNCKTDILETQKWQKSLLTAEAFSQKNKLEGNNEEQITAYEFLIFIPLIKNDSLEALLCAGRNHEPYSNDELFLSNSLIPLYAYLLETRNIVFNQLDKLVTKSRARTAAEIQERLLSNRSLETHYAAYCLHTAAIDGVNSDYHGFYNDEKADQLTLYVADITGRDIHHSSQAIIIIRSIFELLLKNKYEPDKVLNITNRFFIRDKKLENFAQIAILKYSLGQSKVSFAAAGSSALFVYRLATQQMEIVETNEIAIGIDEKQQYRVLESEASSGDIFLTCTDGLIETMDERDSLFGKDRLAKLISDHYFLTVEDLKDRVMEEISQFRGRVQKRDDKTVAILKIY